MDKSYRELFFGESQEYLKEINSALVNLEKNPADIEAITLIFRLTHTLKGMAATMGFTDVAEFAHRLEDFFDTVRSGKAYLSPQTMDIVFDSIDAFATLIGDLKEERTSSVDVGFYLRRIAGIIPVTAETHPVAAPFSFGEEPPQQELMKKISGREKDLFRLTVGLVKDCPLKNARVFLILNALKARAEVFKLVPQDAASREDSFEQTFEVFALATLTERERIVAEISRMMEVEKVTAGQADVAALENSAKSAQARSAVGLIKKISSIRVPTERLDKIMNIMGELSIAKSRFVQTIQSKEYDTLEETSYILERLVSSLQDEALKLRLLPIAYILDNFPRLVRDMARKENKQVELKLDGSEIEIDRVILDEIGDSLMHLVRNAVDHGIESVQERVAAGKPEEGAISIKVSREKGHIVIEVSDDGKGLDYKDVMAQAVTRGFIDQEEARGYDPASVLDILAMPGFSTKQAVTELSGRGVGLDVVRSKMDALGGRLDMSTYPGRGTTFTLTLPLTLAIIKAMLISMGEQIYTIPIMNIRETVKIKESSIKMVKDLEVMQLRGEVIPILRLDKELGLARQRPKDEEVSVVVVEGRDRNMGILVDKVIGEQDIVVKPLSAYVKKVKGIAGATILGNGNVALILDVINLH